MAWCNEPEKAGQSQTGNDARQLALLVHHLFEQERLATQRLAQMLHDRLGQTLAAARLTVDLLTSGQSKGLPPTGKATDYSMAENLLNRAIDSVRQVLVDIRAGTSEHGLGVALLEEVNRHAADETPPRIALEIGEVVQQQRWPAAVEYGAYRIAQEALSNALAHAHAAVIRIQLEGNAEGFCLRVIDDGRGIALVTGERRRLGITAMRERAASIGARLTLAAGDGGGTEVVLSWKAAAA